MAKQAHYLEYEAFALEAPPTQVPAAPGKPMLSPPAKTALIVGGVAVVGIGAVWLLTRKSAAAAAAPPLTGPSTGPGAVWTGGQTTTGGATGTTGGAGGATGTTGGATGATGATSAGYGQIQPGHPVFGGGWGGGSGGMTLYQQVLLTASTPVVVQPSVNGTVTFALLPGAKWWSESNLLKGSFSDHVYPQYYADHINLALDGSPAVAELYWADSSGTEHASVVAFTSGTPNNDPGVTLDPNVQVLQQAASRWNYKFGVYLPAGSQFQHPPSLITNGNWSNPTLCNMGGGPPCMSFTIDGKQGIAIVDWKDAGGHGHVTYIIFA